MRISLRSAVGRLALALAGLLLGLALLEAGMQVLAVFVARRAAPLPGLAAAGARIVCVGDSNTFGLYVGQDKAFPRLLETLWNAEPGRPPIEVVNLGYPGNSSSILRNRFLEVLDTYHPDVVLILIGVNDFWTVPEPIRDEAGSFTGMRVWLWAHSRVYRLGFMLRQAMLGAGDGKSNVAGDFAWVAKEGGVAEWRQLFADNVAALVAASRAAGARPILLTYAASAHVYGEADKEIRRAAEATGAPLIDVTPVFDARCPADRCDLLLNDLHPSAAGHELMARTILAELTTRQLLAEPSP